MYDITNQKSFDDVKYWADRVKENAPNNDLKIILVGNKCDVKNDDDKKGGNKRMVAKQQGQELADSLECLFIETSALENTNVDEAFNMLTDAIYEDLDIDQNVVPFTKIFLQCSQEKPITNSKCC